MSSIIPDSSYDEKLKLLKYKPMTFKIPKVIMKIIHDNNLLDIEDVNERSKIFIKALYVRNLRSTSALKYFNKLKPTLFPNTSILPNSMVFDSNYKKPFQFRGGEIDKIKNFINFVKYEIPNTSPYKWPILISAYSGLRLREVCDIHMSHLSMLSMKKPIVPLKRKNNIDWEVLYYDEFIQLIQCVIDNNEKSYNLYNNHNIDEKLFKFTPQSLHYKVKYFYMLANNNEPTPHGFGLHSVRYYLATVIYNDTGKIDIAQHILGHKKSKTTEIYVKQNYSNREQELKDLCEKSEFYNNVKDIIFEF